MKTITTGTEITFTKTGDKFELIKTDTGFDVKPIKLSKSLSTEPYSFQELLDLYENGKITIDGFEEGDAALVKSILTNYIHTTEIETLKADIARITTENETLFTANEQLASAKSGLDTIIDELRVKNDELAASNTEMASRNKEFSQEIQALNKKVAELNTALEAMDEEK